MIRRLLLAAALVLASLSAQAQLLTTGVGSSGLAPVFSIQLIGASSLPAIVSFARASSETNGLYTDAAGSSFTSFGNNVPVFQPGGLQVYEARTNFLLNSAAPVTQTTASLATGIYTFWCIGTGSITSSAGTATATGLGALTCSQSTVQSINVTIAGTLTFTKSGSVDRFQLEKGFGATPFVATTGTTAARAADLPTVALSSFAFNQNAATVIAQVTRSFVATDGSTPQVIIALDDGTSANDIDVHFRSAGSNFSRVIRVASTNVVQVDAGTEAGVNVSQKAGFAWKSGADVLYANNTLVGSDTPASIPTNLTTLRLGYKADGTSYLNGLVQAMTVYGSVLTNAQIQALTK